MKIVEEKEYRSKGRKVNQSHDMMRVTIDMTKNDYYKLLAYIKQEWRGDRCIYQKTGDNKSY